jgi:integrase/recombinase XerD
MNRFQKAIRDYVDLRRSLGYKLREAPALLADFVAFLEKQKADYITIPLALQWAPS